MGKKQFCFFQTAETGNRTPDSGVKGSGANHYPRAPALHTAHCSSRPILAALPKRTSNSWSVARGYHIGYHCFINVAIFRYVSLFEGSIQILDKRKNLTVSIHRQIFVSSAKWRYLIIPSNLLHLIKRYSSSLCHCPWVVLSRLCYFLFISSFIP